MRVARRFVIAGRVQGVGFRWTVLQICTQVGARGWVRNLPDGSVEAVFVGNQEVGDEAVRRIREARRGYIRDLRESVTEVPAPPDGFEIRHA